MKGKVSCPFRIAESRWLVEIGIRGQKKIIPEDQH